MFRDQVNGIKEGMSICGFNESFKGIVWGLKRLYEYA